MHLDTVKYRPFLDRYDISDTEKDEIIGIVATITQNFVDRAFRKDAVQLALRDKEPKSASDDASVIDLTPICNGAFGIGKANAEGEEI